MSSADATMMRLLVLRGMHHGCICCARDSSRGSLLHLLRGAVPEPSLASALAAVPRSAGVPGG